MAASSTKRTKEVSARRNGIDSCLRWLQSLRQDGPTDNNNDIVPKNRITFEPDRSGDHDGIGVYAKTAIRHGDVILSLPMSAALTLDHALFSGPQLSKLMETCRNELQALIDKEAATVSPHDRYAKMKGRVLLKNYLLLSFLVTLMWMEDEITTTASWSSEISVARQYWNSMMETEPHDWSHVPLLWTPDDLDMIRGTSFHALAVRMQDEMHQVFQNVFLPTLLANNDDDVVVTKILKSGITNSS